MQSLILLISLLPLYSFSIEPITISLTAAGGLASAATYLYHKYGKCMYWECCQKPWVRESLSLDFSDLYGQPLAVKVISETLKRRHLLHRPIAMSFHGPPGTGKSFVSSIIAKILFEKGDKSEYAHIFSVSYHFPNPAKDMQYNVMLNDIIKSTLKKCKKSIFIFEEFDKMTPKAVSAVTSFLEPRGHIDDVNTSQAIFIFIANTGQEAIISKTYELWKNGVHRDDFVMSDFENLLRLAAQQNKGPFNENMIESKGLIDMYIPFLPLEKHHVKKCIEADFWSFNNRSATPREVEDILKDVPFTPKKDYLYAETGCRKVRSLTLRY